MTKKIIIGSRGSKLALLYAQKAKDTIIQNSNLGNEDIVIKTITTQGDHCLLYTSPSPRDRQKSRMPSSA